MIREFLMRDLEFQITERRSIRESSIANANGDSLYVPANALGNLLLGTSPFVRRAGIPHAFDRCVNGSEDRVERRHTERRASGSATDVSRIEHENLFRQVDEVLRRIVRIELELREHDARLDVVESAVGGASRNSKRSK